MTARLFEGLQQLGKGQAHAMPDLGFWGAAFEHAGIGLAIGEVESQTVLAVNPAFAIRRGSTTADYVGRRVHELFPADLYAEVAEQIARADQLGHLIFESEHVCRDGSRFPVLVDVTVIKDPAGRPINRIVHVLDTSALKTAEARLQEQQLLLTQMSSVAHIAGWVYDVATATARWTGELHRIYELPDGEPLDLRASFQYYVPEDHDRVFRAVRDAIDRGIAYDLEARIAVPSGIKWVHAIGKPVVDEHGQVTQLRGTLQDITARRRMEEDRLQTAASLRESEQRYRELSAQLEQRVIERTTELEQANRAKTDFLANMSHELRTPLNAIIGFSELLRDGMLGPLDAQQQRFISDIWDAGKHLHSLINDVLDLSKVEAGTLELDLAAAESIQPLLESSLAMVRTKAQKHGIDLTVRIDDIGAPRLDRRKTKQIVYNLLSNAVKFTGQGGRVELTARRCPRADVALAGPGTRVLPFDAADHDDFIEISVTDTGVGIAPEFLPQLFQSFVQLKASYTRSLEGTGLGLSLVRQFAQLHGGTVGVASTPGAGSRFYVWLPWRAAD